MWIDRMNEIGIVDRMCCLEYGISGIVVRGIGIRMDVRLSDFETGWIRIHIIVGNIGDSLDRYLCRMNECIESSS